MFYLIQNDISFISYSFIEEICEVYVNNLSILSLFSEKYKESYKASCIINDILNYYDKWDVYSLSLLYLHIFGNISRVFSLKQTFISKITVELSKNISPDPLERSSLEKLLENYNKLFDEETNWSFVEKIKVNNMPILFEFLDK